jgi:hypothetical protein
MIKMRPIVFLMLSIFWWVKDDLFVLKSNANLVINTTCMLLYLSKDIFIWVQKLSIQDLFLGELIQGLISLAWD